MPQDQGPWSQPEPEPPPRRTGSPARKLVWIVVIAAVGGAVVLLSRSFPGQDRQDWFYVAWGLTVLAAISARVFTAGPINWSQKTRHAAVWIGIVMVAALGFTYRAELLGVGQRLRGELIPSYAQSGGAHELVVTQGESGFTVMGQVNGQPVRFVVDTGATDTVLSPADAHRAGLDTPSLEFDHLAETANGTGRGARAVAATLSVGSIGFTNVPVVINQAPMSGSLLGMSFLRRLESFEVRDGRLFLKGPG
jgi:aspartyl protease family protein